jgi:hypothetical protein
LVSDITKDGRVEEKGKRREEMLTCDRGTAERVLELVQKTLEPSSKL